VVYFQNKRALVFQNDDWWQTVVGIPLETKAGRYEIQLKTEAGGTDVPFLVKAKEYPAQYLVIKNKRMVNPNLKDLEKIKADRILIMESLNAWTDQLSIDFNFKTPVDGRLSSRFGLRRFFNKQPRNPHSGLDIAAPRKITCDGKSH